MEFDFTSGIVGFWVGFLAALLIVGLMDRRK